MKKSTKLLALMLAVVMCFSVLSACGKTEEKPATENKPAETQPNTPAVEESTYDPNKPMVVGYSPFSSKFSPFFAATVYDQDVAAMTQIGLLGNDRAGAMILNGIEGEVHNYNGTDYTYTGPADLVITENEDGTVYYDFTLRDDIKFSDGEPLTVDDVIFSMYVLCDPTYDGSSTLYGQPIEGMEAYRSGMDNLINLLLAAGRDNADFTYWDEATQEAFWADLDQAGPKFAQSIVDYVYANYGAAYSLPDPAEGPEAFEANAGMWGFGGGNADEMWAEMDAVYEGDYAAMSDTEAADVTLFDCFNDYSAYVKGITTGESAPNISGIQKTGENTFRVVMTQVDATAIYQLSLSVAPMHYYGDVAKYDYENNRFGFDKGDLSTVRAKTTQPMGAGPYKFVKFQDGVVYFEANENYFKGAPKTKYVNFQECTADDDKLNGVINGTIDVGDPSFSSDTVAAIEKANGGVLNGDVVQVNTVDNLGYGYIGIAANRVNVNGEIDSPASKNLRKAIATVFAVYRDLAVDSYYGDRASVINYPISNTSWAAPQPTDDGYKLAFSVDVDGNDIYTAAMKAEDKYAAAAQAALGFFEAAGYTVEDGKITAAPEGAAMEYECWIPADGTGDHPSFMVLTEAAKAFEEIGFKLIVKDLSNSADLWTALDADEVDMWCAAWGATIDPDMYQVYHSTNVDGLPGSTGSNEYNIQDAELDQLIMDARASTDQAYRKSMYKACLDIIIDWAVEIPVYQRQNAIIFSNERIDMDTITPDITTFYGWMSEVENTMMK